MAEENNKKNNKNVNWIVFAWAMGIILLILGYFFTSMNGLQAKVDGSTIGTNDLKVQMAQLQVDVSWIKNAIIQLQIDKGK
jgi:hypothetical protein